jgi:general secretion pathway protein L
VPRGYIGELLEILNYAGVGIHRVDLAGSADAAGAPSTLGINLLPPEARARRLHRRLRFNIMLGLIMVLVVALVMGQSLYVRKNQVAAMEDAVDSIRQEARLVANMEQQYQESLAAAQFLNTQRARQAYTVDLLADVTRVIPDDTYLQRITVNDDLIRLQGLSDAAQRLLTHLNDSKMLVNASFETSQINVDARTGKERFNVSATVVPLERSGESAGSDKRRAEPLAAADQGAAPDADNSSQEQVDETAAGE